MRTRGRFWKEGCTLRVHSVCRRDWASRSASDNSLCIRSEGDQRTGFLWPRQAQKCILMPDARTAVEFCRESRKRAELPLLLLKLCRCRSGVSLDNTSLNDRNLLFTKDFQRRPQDFLSRGHSSNVKLQSPQEKIAHLSTERGASHGSYICQSL